jgi:hypothetical protein
MLLINVWRSGYEMLDWHGRRLKVLVDCFYFAIMRLTRSLGAVKSVVQDSRK